MFAKQVYVMSSSVLILLLGAIGIAAAIGPGREGNAEKADLMKLEGTWRMVSVEIGDKSVDLKDRYEQIFITGNKITVKSGFRVTDFQFTINPLQTSGAARDPLVRDVLWALLNSTEFRFNH